MSDSKCNEIRDVFQAGRVPSGTELSAHVRTCERCRTLLARDGRLGVSLGGLARAGRSDVSALKASVLRNARREVGLRAWLRSRSRRQRLGLLIAVTLLLAGMSALAGGRIDPRSAEPLLLWGPAAVYLGGILVGLLELVADPARPVHFARRTQLAVALALLPALAMFWTASGLAPHAGGTDASSKSALTCFLFGSVFTVSLLVCLWLLDRNDRASRSAASLAAVSAGVFGTLAVHLSCAVDEPGHLVFGHLAVLPSWVLILMTATRWRSAASASHDRRARQ